MIRYYQREQCPRDTNKNSKEVHDMKTKHWKTPVRREVDLARHPGSAMEQ
jgi:hypothetical protein